MSYSELATNLVEMLPIVPNKFSVIATKDYYAYVYFPVKNQLSVRRIRACSQIFRHVVEVKIRLNKGID